MFKNRLQLSSLETGKIKTASIIRFALRYLVTVTPAEHKKSLFNYWKGNKEALLSIDEAAIQEYVKFCTEILKNYFSAVRKRFRIYWDDENSKILSVISINGFVIALNRQLDVNGIQGFEYYDQVFTNWNFDFSKDNFPYTSSQYRKFSSQILDEAFHLDASIY